MSRIVVIGERQAVAGYRLAGADVVEAEDAEAARAAWAALPDDTGLVLVTASARGALGDRPDGRRLLLAVIPS